MSTSFYAYAVIGIEIDRGKLDKPPRLVKAFEHDYPDTFQFDPQTGDPLWREAIDRVDGYDEDNAAFHGWKIVYGTEGEPRIMAAYVCYDRPGCVRHTGDGINRFLPLPSQHDLDIRKGIFRELLEPLGMWDESKWGLYAVADVSY